MARPGEPHVEVIVESYHESGSGLHGDMHVRPVAGQGYDTGMRVRCPKGLAYGHPSGTKFKIIAKLTDREGGRPFLSTYHGWKWEVVP